MQVLRHSFIYFFQFHCLLTLKQTETPKEHMLRSYRSPDLFRILQQNNSYHHPVKMKNFQVVCNHLYYLLILVLILSELIHHQADAYCWQSGWHPSFISDPKVSQISLGKVRISWVGVVKQRECADSFLVKYWRTSTPSNYKLTDPIDPIDIDYIDLDVTPKVSYLYQVIARKDKKLLIDYNKARPVPFKTSWSHTQPPPSTPGNIVLLLFLLSILFY